MSNRRKRRREQKNQKQKRYFGFMAIPLLIIIIVVVIMTFDRSADSQMATASNATPNEAVALTLETDAVEPDNKQYEIDFSDLELQKDEEAELYQLVANYCQAKMDADIELLCQVFNNKTMSDDEKIEKTAEMELERKYVTAYENITCYYVKGLEPDTFVIYPYFEIKYREAELAIPCLTVAYAVKDEDGNYYMSYIFDDARSEYIEKANTMEDIRLLSTQIEARIDEVVAQDEVLQSIYGSIKAAPEGAEREIAISPSEEGEDSQQSDEDTSSGEIQSETSAP